MISAILLVGQSGRSIRIRKNFPIDINALSTTLKRSKLNDGVVRQVIIDLQFIKNGRTFLKNEFEQNGGPDARVVATIYRLDANTRTEVVYFTGRVNFAAYEVYEDRIVVDVEQTGFQRSVESSLEVPVDLATTVDVFGNALPANDPIDLPLHAKAILKTFQKTGAEFIFHLSDDGSAWFIPGLDIGALNPVLEGEENLFIDEITKRTSTVTGISDTYPVDINLYQFKLDVGGEYRIVIDSRLRITPTGIPIKSLTAQAKLVYGKQGAYTVVNVGPLFNRPGGELNERIQLDQTFTLEAGFEIYFFVSFTFTGGGGPVEYQYVLESFDLENEKYLIKIEALTKRPDSITKAFLNYEAVRRCVQFYTGQEDCFKSELLGRTDLAYAEDGAGALVAHTNGNNIRLRQKPVLHSLQSLLDTNNALFGIGVGYEVEGGVQRLRLEKKEYFYNKNLRALSLGKVYNVRRRLDVSRLYSQIRFGFNSKIDLDQINATDAFNTIRQYILPLRNSKNILDFSTTVKADGYQIEYQRNLINLTTDGKLDDENFIVSIVRDGEGYKAKKDEGYENIVGVIDPASGYNYDFAPGRCARNWLKYIASSLIYSPNKEARFGSGEVNYEMSSKKVDEAAVKENDPISLFGVIPIWKPFVIEFETQRLSCSEFEELASKANGYVEFQDNFGNTFQGFIDEGVSHNPSTLEVDFKLLEVFR